jgi:hypothetical protein
MVTQIINTLLVTLGEAEMDGCERPEFFVFDSSVLI